MKKLFTSNSYDTPANVSRLLGDRLALNSRWYFVYGFMREIWRSRALALKGCFDTKAWAESSYRILKLAEGCGGRFHIRGLEHLQTGMEPVVFISNHMSTLETFVFQCMIAPKVPVAFIVKESLVKHPIFGPVMRATHPIVVKRVNPRDDFEEVMKQGKKLLNAGVSVIVFPQSTRSVEFIPAEFNSLGIKLAKAAEVKVLPIAVKTDFWGNSKLKLMRDAGPVNRNKPIYITFGEALAIHGTGKVEHQQIIDFISRHLHKWATTRQ